MLHKATVFLMPTVIFATQFFPAIGSAGQTGGTISNMSLLRAIARRHDVIVLSFDQASGAQDFDGHPFRVVARPAPAWRAPQLTMKWIGYVRSQVSSVLENEPAPLALIATTSTLATLDVAPRGAKKIAVVQAYENFGAMCPWVPLGQRLNLLKLAAVHRFQDARLMRQADVVITNSDFMRSAINLRFGIDPCQIKVMPQIAEVTPSPNFPPPPGTVGFVHRGPDKNIALVIEIAKRAPDLRFLVFGHTKALKNRLPENIELRGWINDRTRMFASAAIWIAPSLWAEPFGRVSIEAQAADRPVLVANAGGLPETVLDRSRIVDGYDPGEWLARIRATFDEPSDRVRENGDMIRNRFSHYRHDAEYMQLIELLERIS